MLCPRSWIEVIVALSTDIAPDSSSVSWVEGVSKLRMEVVVGVAPTDRMSGWVLGIVVLVTRRDSNSCRR